MSASLLVSLTPLEGKDENLSSTAVSHNGAFDLSIGHFGSSNKDFIVLLDHQHGIQRYLASNVTGNLFNTKPLPFFDAVLFSACLNNGVDSV